MLSKPFKEEYTKIMDRDEMDIGTRVLQRSSRVDLLASYGFLVFSGYKIDYRKDASTLTRLQVLLNLILPFFITPPYTESG